LLSLSLISTSCTKKTKTCKCISTSTGDSYTWDRQTSCSDMESSLESLYGGDFRCSEWYNY
jgi:hypothetical protein